jgi:Fe-S oxidoreductase
LLDGLVVRETLPVAGAADVGVPATAGADGSHARCCGKGVEGYGRPEDEQLAMAAQRIAEAQAAGADVLVTACGTCARALTDTRAHAAANAHASTAPNCGTSTLRVCHYLELLFDRQEEW